MFKRWAWLGSGQGWPWVVWHGPCLRPVGHDESVISFGSCFFLVWVGFWVKNHGLYPTHGLLRVKIYGRCLFVALIRSGFFDRPGRVGHDRVTHASSSRLSKTNLKDLEE
jgi:hypothetical protein